MPTHSSDIPKQLSDEAIAWVVRVHSSRCTEEERARLAAWRRLSTDHEQAYREACRLWQDMGTALLGDPAPAVPVETAARPPATAPRRMLLWTGWAVAASLAALAFLHHFHYTDPWLSDYHTATGEQALVHLEDGSTVLLNTDTALSLADDKETRRLRLHHGQALFTVAPDPARPFEVEAGGGLIRALGTVFEVYENAGQVAITVQEHAVQVRPKADEGSQAIIVTAGERLRYDAAGHAQAPEKIDVRERSAWQRRKLVFKDRPLAEVIGEVNRYRRGRIVITSEHLHDLRVTGLFPTGDAEAVLKVIRETLPIQTTRISPWLVFLHQ